MSRRLRGIQQQGDSGWGDDLGMKPKGEITIGLCPIEWGLWGGGGSELHEGALCANTRGEPGTEKPHTGTDAIRRTSMASDRCNKMNPHLLLLEIKPTNTS